MVLWIIKHAIFSIVIITLMHYLYIFFKNNLTVPKIKDLVNRPEQKYREIYKSLEKKPAQKKSVEKTNIDMKAELKNYLKGLGKQDDTPLPQGDTEPVSANSFNNSFQTF